MVPLLTESATDSLVLIAIACIGIIPATLAAYWSRTAKNNSIEAKENSAGALHEVKSNGGMLEPDPTLKDKINHLIDVLSADGRRLDKLQDDFYLHLRHSQVMDEALAEVFFAIKPDLKRDDLSEIFKN